jgi:hypothetical protein
MFLIRRSLAAAALVAALWLLRASPASSQSLAAPPGGTIVVVPLTVTTGTPIATAEAGMKEMAAFISTQPGLVEQSLLASSFPGNRPSHIDVTRWRSLKDWEALSDSPEFLSLMKSKAALFEWRPAEVFVPIE